jgi:predicted transcriptional regulator
MARDGDLERAVLVALWDRPGGASAREVADALPGRELAITTVLTVLNRLRRKGMVRREPVGRAHRYFAARSRAQFLSGLMADALDQSDDRAAVLATFVGRMDPGDAAALREALGGAGPALGARP